MAKHVWQLDGIGYLAKFVCAYCGKAHTTDEATSNCSVADRLIAHSSRLVQHTGSSMTITEYVKLIYYRFMGYI